jgi:hypothetical protein
MDALPRRFPGHRLAPGPLRWRWRPAPANNSSKGERPNASVLNTQALQPLTRLRPLLAPRMLCTARRCLPGNPLCLS